MNSNKLIAAALGMTMSWLVVGNVQAEDSSDKHDRQVCELEAEEAGMVSANDIRAYVEQCMEEIRLQNEGHDMGHDNENDNSGSWE